MAADLFRILEILSAAILVLSMVRCLISHDRDPVYVNPYGKLKNPTDLNILIEVYYDALDDVSEDFVTQQLIPAYDKLINVTDIILVPYGKIRMFQNSNGSYEIQCLHDPTQCEANLQHACVIDNVGDIRTKLQLIGCLMRTNEAMLPSNGLHKCSQEHHLSQLDFIQQCVKGTRGLKLLKRNGDMTNESSKGRFQPPFVVLNGSTTLEAKLVGNLFANICKIGNDSVILKKVCENKLQH